MQRGSPGEGVRAWGRSVCRHVLSGATLNAIKWPSVRPCVYVYNNIIMLLLCAHRIYDDGLFQELTPPEEQSAGFVCTLCTIATTTAGPPKLS